MLIIIYDNSSPSPRTVASTIKETNSCLLRKSSTAIFSSAVAPKLSGSITEGHADNSFLRNSFIHLWTHIGVEFTQYVRSTASTLGEDTLLILVSNLLYTFFYLSLFFLVSSFSSILYFMFYFEWCRLRLTYFFMSLCTSNNIDSISNWIARLHFRAWSWPGWSNFIACFRCSSLTVACSSAIRFRFRFTIFL